MLRRPVLFGLLYYSNYSMPIELLFVLSTETKINTTLQGL